MSAARAWIRADEETWVLARRLFRDAAVVAIAAAPHESSTQHRGDGGGWERLSLVERLGFFVSAKALLVTHTQPQGRGRTELGPDGQFAGPNADSIGQARGSR